jgi:hypothetical protein
MPELRQAGSTEGLRTVVNGDAGPAPSHSVRPPLLVRYGRPVMAGLLLMLVILGVGAAGPGAGGPGPWHQHALIIWGSLEVAFAALQLGLFVRGRYSAPADPLPAILRKDLRRVILAAMLAVLAVAAASALDHDFGGARPRILQPQTGRPANPFAHLPTVAHGGSDHLRYLLDAVFALVLLAAVVVCAILIARMRPRGSYGFAVEAEDESSSLRTAVESGRAALRAVDDARAAIIACYLAMESSLAKAGTARTAAETPDELLTRATATGLLRGPAAGELTALFYEARFSSHDLRGSVKAEAMAALDAISAELRSTAADSSQSAPADQPDRAVTGASQ